MPNITPFLWFNDQAEEAMNFYVSIFKNSKVVAVTRYGDGGPGPKGSVMTASFQLDGQEFTALNGGRQFTFTPAISFVVHCETQKDVDEYWQKLGGVGPEQQCWWLSDKYGLSWQLVPKALTTMLQDSDPERKKRVMNALMKMQKLDVERLKQAYEGVVPV